jgi:hypothetical protein
MVEDMQCAETTVPRPGAGKVSCIVEWFPAVGYR